MSQQQAGAGGAPNLQLSPAERLAFAHYFSLADPSNSGIIQGQAAVPFFAKSKLPPPTLGQIWTIADSANNGFLTAPTFSVALRLIGHAQRGETPDEAMIQRPGPPPVLEGIQLPNLPAGASPMSPQRTGSLPPQPAIQIRPEDRSRYTRIFASAGPSGGMLDGEKAKEIFVKSRLPFDKLGAIWNLADTKSRGSLDLADFIIGMHFIQATMSGAIQNVPAVLPPGLYDAAAGTGSVTPGSPLRAQQTGGSASAAPQQMWGVAPMSPTPTGSAGNASFIAAQRTGGLGAPFSPAGPNPAASQWAVTPTDKAKADQFFDGLDTDRRGELPGNLVVPFFMQSKLSETVLANIWDLSDVTQSGSLSREEFAVAMHLINAALTGGEVPQELPANLVPPSLRGTKLPQAVDPQQTDTQKDLFSLMDDDPSDLPVSTATAFAAPVAGAPIAHGVSAAAPGAAAKSSPFDDDFFTSGDSDAQPAAKGASTQAAAGVTSPKPAPTPAAGGSSRAVPTNQSAEYGNKSLQLNSTQKAVDDLQSKRSTLETGVAQNASTLAEIESRLATVRSTHETESRLVKDLEARRDKQAAELKTLRDELISEESTLSRLKAEKDEVEQQVMHDREEVRVAKKRMAEVQGELSTLKAEVEKLRKEGRQQKGMVAIAKKQLSTAEGEHEKVKGEHKELSEAPVQDAEEPQQQSREPPTMAGGLSVPGATEPVASPAGSTQSLNPFDRFNSGGTDREAGSGGHGGAIAGGLAAGAAAATAGVGAMHLAEPSDKKGATNNQDDEDDPFGMNTGATASQQQPPASRAHTFDDAFGDDFAPSSGQQQQAPPASNVGGAAPGASFDDAFGSFDDDLSGGEPAAGAQSDRGLASGEQTAVDAPTAMATAEPAAPAPTADEVATDADVADTGDTMTSSKGKGKEPIRGADAEDEAGYSSSSDGEDDEGPEDLDGYKHGGARGTAASSEPNTISSGGEEQLPPATTTAGASERFPELDDDDSANNSSLPLAAGAGAGAAVAGGAGAAALGGGLMPPSTSSATSLGGNEFLSSQNTGTTDAAFVDAADSAGHTTSGATSGIPAATAQEERSVTPAMPGAFGSGTAGAAGMSGFDDDFAAAPVAPAPAVVPPPTVASMPPAADDAGTAQLSPANSTKTRRAPPPAPVRSGTLGSAQSSAPSAPAAATAPAQQQPSFDDFESSFADFGSANTTNASTASAGTEATTKTATAGSLSRDEGFEDAFDDADFDFVPSFDNNKASGGASNTASSAFPGASTAPADNNAFAGFDDAFGPAATSTTGGAGATGSKSTSDPSSAFSSFEDAFAPSEDGAAGASSSAAPAFASTTPATASNAPSSSAPPPVPARSATGGATGPFAPPPGPPPGVAPKSSSGGTGGSEPTAALPDDAPAVRQLAGMGFPRNKVIAALEKSNYRVEKALERLLADS
ncbi:hypothetical protein BDZ90DRAFT_226762 [Jaminaea rosea]|uniref:Uncharacterized protein n=1 Tax=Jaminaea rosea TaxID=1569628 RepID=A0A316UT42_9BASI|nr:hypothetical protein BDZ90DRAFT_226762 [Jaminaea rosea]PWN27958.1 hypothetical protein BDZ90DRAFT_226762 [Jaminaea rosea]